MFFCAYLLFAISTGRLDIILVHRMFETRHGMLTFFIIGAFSLLTNVILMAHTRLFILFLRAYPSGSTFLLLACSDMIVKITLFAIVFSLGILFSVLAIDVTMKKDIPGLSNLMSGLSGLGWSGIRVVPVDVDAV